MSEVDPDILEAVLTMRDRYAAQWRDRPDLFWLARLMEEVGELSAALVGDHRDTPDWELQQIASIALNWLSKRAQAQTPDHE